MITFETLSGEVVKITSAIDQDSFRKAANAITENATFKVGKTIYFMRCVSWYSEKIHRGPYQRRGLLRSGIPK